MIVKKLAGLFAVFGLMVFLGTWIILTLSFDGGASRPMDAERMWEVGIYLAAALFCLGLFVSTLGVALVREAQAESGSKDMERKFRAKSTYDRIVAMAMDPTEARHGESGAFDEGVGT